MSGEVQRGPGVSVSAHRQYLEARAKRQAAIAREEAEIERIATAANTTREAARQAIAERKAKKAEAWRADQLAEARKAAGTPRGRGRPRLTEGRVRADLERALAVRAESRGIARPTTWEQVASAHDGAGDFGLSTDALTNRQKRFPEPFRELVPHLMLPE